MDHEKSAPVPPVVLRSRRLACQNSKWEVYLDHISAPGGEEVKDYLVISPKHSRKDLITGVTVLPVQNGRLSLLEVWRHGIGEFSWEAVRGFLEPNENIHDAARRELREETGLTCKKADLISLGVVAPENSTITGKAALFAATQCKLVESPDLGAEPGLGKLRQFSLGEVLEMAMDSRLQDATTLVAIFRYWARTKQKAGFPAVPGGKAEGSKRK